MNILFLSGWYPYPPDNGSKLRIFNLIHGISEYHDVYLISLINDGDRNLSSELEDQCTIVRAIPRSLYNPKSVRSILGFFSPTPRAIIDTLLPDVQSCIEQELSYRKYDLIIASQWMMAAYWRSFKGVPAIYEELELGIFHTRKDSAATSLSRLRHKLPLLKLNFYLRRVLPHFKACTIVSEQEKIYLCQMVPKYRPIEIIPNCVDLKSYKHIQSEVVANRMIFSGSLRYSANYDAMVWFIKEILPRIHTKVPDAHLLITGDHGNLPLPPSRNVTLTGWVKDVRRLIASSTVSLAPIRFGGGTRLKIIEAMALHSPVVTTSIGVEGLKVTNDNHVLIADAPDLFAEEVVRVLKKPRLRERLSNSAYELVCMEYDWGNVIPRFIHLIEGVVDT